MVVYRLVISLSGTEPAVWRRLVVPADFTLDMVHKVFQMVMGWQNCHAHEFVAGSGGDRRIFGEVCGDDGGVFFGARILDEKKYRLADLLKSEEGRCLYTYDFGDNWEHEVVLEEVIHDVEAGASLRCLEGKGACPPEDCGGIPGYCELLGSLRDPDDPEHVDTVEWFGKEFDPEAFDCSVLNEHFSMVLSRFDSPEPVDEDMSDHDIFMELNDFLASEAVPETGMTLMMLDGYLAALAVLPAMLSTGSWMSLVWDMSGKGAEPRFASDEEAARIMALLLSYVTGVAELIEEEPDEYTPLYDELVLESDEERAVVAREWAIGFMAGVVIDERVRDLTNSDVEGRNALAPIVALSGIAGDAVVLDAEEVVDLMEGMGDTVQELKAFWLPWRRRLAEEERASRTVRVTERVGRNELCPCGSGKKYKKCCGP